MVELSRAEDLQGVVEVLSLEQVEEVVVPSQEGEGVLVYQVEGVVEVLQLQKEEEVVVVDHQGYQVVEGEEEALSCQA